MDFEWCSNKIKLSVLVQKLHRYTLRGPLKVNEISKFYLKLLSSVKFFLNISSNFCGFLRIYELLYYGPNFRTKTWAFLSPFLRIISQPQHYFWGCFGLNIIYMEAMRHPTASKDVTGGLWTPESLGKSWGRGLGSGRTKAKWPRLSHWSGLQKSNGAHTQL